MCTTGYLLSVLTLSTAVSGSMYYYPPFFNAALMTPISVSPSTSICGSTGRTTYCESMVDYQSTRSCGEEICDMSCPRRTSLPTGERINAFQHIHPSYQWGDCVVRDTTLRAPLVQNSEVKNFLGRSPSGSGSCYVDLDSNWMAPVVLMSSQWTSTIIMWVYHTHQATKGTLLELADNTGVAVLRLYVEQGVLKLRSGSAEWSRPEWILPDGQWTHLALQIYSQSVSVFLNGTFVSPALYNLNLRPPASSVMYRVGNNQARNEPFQGYMDQLHIYTVTVTNREVQALFNGTFPEVRIQNTCRCPPSHPALKPSNELYCVQNEGEGRVLTEEYRIRRGSQGEAHPLELVNDGIIDSAWIGQPGEEIDVITVDLKQTFEVHNVELKLYSPYPSNLIIERHHGNMSDWDYWQFFSQDCVKETGYMPEAVLTSETDIICKYFFNPSTSKDSIKYSSGVVTLNLLEGRPGQNDNGDFTPELRKFLLASSIRITMRGHPYVIDSRHKYHGIYDIKVNATCDCYGRGQTCDTSVTPYQCGCVADTYTSGRQCDQCHDGTYRDPDLGDYDVGLCQACDCNVNGTVTGHEKCDMAGGQCTCKRLATGRQCDVCIPGYYNLARDNLEGCEPCTCNTTGTVNGSNVCDIVTGQCVCKDNVEGKNCDRCTPGYFTEDFTGSDGCFSCECNVNGTEAGQTECNVITGQCVCKQYATGRTCGECQDGFYNLSSTNEGCQSCDCDPIGSNNTSCDHVTGQCECKTNVEGRTCDVCKPGYFALDEDDLKQNGCTHTCQCTPDGTVYGEEDCEDIGGQCPCRTSVEGRTCDTCKNFTFGLGRSKALGCIACGCDIDGTVNSTQSCDVITGQCPCKSKVEGQKCAVCIAGSYGLNASNPDGCTDCGCFPAGTIPGGVCSNVTGQCPCRPGEGLVELGGLTCIPYVQGFHPQYGPESGGTRVVINTGFLGDFMNVTAQFANIDCPVIEQKGLPTEVICLTKSLREVNMTSILREDLELTLNVQSGLELTPEGTNFMYKEDPVISTIYPLKSFLKGGIMLTVTGMYLDSVAYPMFEVHMVYHKQNKVTERRMFETNCTVLNSTVMKCPTPNIILPEGYQYDTTIISRKRREVEKSSRLRRDIPNDDDDERLNSDLLEFYIGFRLDGVTTYRNMSERDVLQGVLSVYNNPEFEMFKEKDHVKYFRTYWPYNHKHFTIKGRRINHGADEKDYTIGIGQGNCTDFDLSSNTIVCIPPLPKPDPSEGLGHEGAPEVMIQVGNINFFVGYLKYESSFWDNPKFRWGIIGGIIALIVLILFIILICCLCKRQRRKKKERRERLKMMEHPFDTWQMNGSTDKIMEDENRDMGLIVGNQYISSMQRKGTQNSGYLRPDNTLLKNNQPDLVAKLPPELQATVRHCLVDEHLLNLGKLIGEGHFGRVYIGQLSDGKHPYQEPIAVKTLRGYNVPIKDIINFLEEATLMSEFHHDHVLGLTGVVIRDNQPYVLLPYMENGDLKSFISNDENMLTVGELIHFGMQIADGMHYLAEKHFVHRDLACRNCMISKDFLVKVADFGLSRDIYTNDYYKVNNKKRPLPVKWMAPESLETGIFNSKTDVWSFGVVLWELLTRGCQPYPDVDNFDMKTFILCGNRMDRPDYAPDEMYILMLECWDNDPQRRPNFRKIYNRIATFLDESSTKTVMRDHQSQQVPSIAYRGRSYIDIVNT